MSSMISSSLMKSPFLVFHFMVKAIGLTQGRQTQQPDFCLLETKGLQSIQSSERERKQNNKKRTFKSIPKEPDNSIE